MTSSKTLLDELSTLAKRFGIAYDESNDPMTGAIAAVLYSVTGCAYAGQVDLLMDSGQDMAIKGLLDIQSRRL